MIASFGYFGRVAEWQTGWLQVPVSFGTWGFKSPFAHPNSCRSKHRFIGPTNPVKTPVKTRGGQNGRMASIRSPRYRKDGSVDCDHEDCNGLSTNSGMP